MTAVLISHLFIQSISIIFSELRLWVHLQGQQLLLEFLIWIIIMVRLDFEVFKRNVGISDKNICNAI